MVNCLERALTVLTFPLLFLAAPLIAQEPASAETAQAAEAEPQDEAPESETRYQKTIRWATASEVDNFGYDIYRAESEDGPFERINPEPILGAGTTDEPSYYKYVDDTLDPSLTYYYYVESISIHGVRERFTPIQKVEARPSDEETEKADEEEPEGGGPGL